MTPRHSQGFKPHYDDIDAFIVQVEGTKRWRLYHPKREEDVLARFSSGDFDVDGCGMEGTGELVTEVLLKPGHCMYMPRGLIHEAVSNSEDSLHLTLSINQRVTFMDFLLELMPAALEEMSQTNQWSFLKRTLPRESLGSIGVMHSNADAEADGEEDPVGAKEPKGSPSLRTAFFHAMGGVLSSVVDYAPVDATMDQIGKRILLSRLPPISPRPDDRVEGGTLRINDSIAVTAPNAARLIVEDDNSDPHAAGPQEDGEAFDLSSGIVRVVHCFSNDVRMHADCDASSSNAAGVLKFPIDFAPGIEAILRAPCGERIPIASLPLPDDAQKLSLARALHLHGIVRRASGDAGAGATGNSVPQGRENRAAMKKKKKRRKKDEEEPRR